MAMGHQIKRHNVCEGCFRQVSGTSKALWQDSRDWLGPDIIEEENDYNAEPVDSRPSKWLIYCPDLNTHDVPNIHGICTCDEGVRFRRIS